MSFSSYPPQCRLLPRSLGTPLISRASRKSDHEESSSDRGFRFRECGIVTGQEFTVYRGRAGHTQFRRGGPSPQTDSTKVPDSSQQSSVGPPICYRFHGGTASRKADPPHIQPEPKIAYVCVRGSASRIGFFPDLFMTDFWQGAQQLTHECRELTCIGTLQQNLHGDIKFQEPPKSNPPKRPADHFRVPTITPSILTWPHPARRRYRLSDRRSFLAQQISCNVLHHEVVDLSLYE